MILYNIEKMLRLQNCLLASYCKKKAINAGMIEYNALYVYLNIVYILFFFVRLICLRKLNLMNSQLVFYVY